jgi:hypothetical protein
MPLTRPYPHPFEENLSVTTLDERPNKVGVIFVGDLLGKIPPRERGYRKRLKEKLVISSQ